MFCKLESGAKNSHGCSFNVGGITLPLASPSLNMDACMKCPRFCPQSISNNPFRDFTSSLGTRKLLSTQICRLPPVTFNVFQSTPVNAPSGLNMMVVHSANAELETQSNRVTRSFFMVFNRVYKHRNRTSSTYGVILGLRIPHSLPHSPKRSASFLGTVRQANGHAGLPLVQCSYPAATRIQWAWAFRRFRHSV